jgi:hypothetical protein
MKYGTIEDDGMTPNKDFRITIIVYALWFTI